MTGRGYKIGPPPGFPAAPSWSSIVTSDDDSEGSIPIDPYIFRRRSSTESVLQASTLAPSDKVDLSSNHSNNQSPDPLLCDSQQNPYTEADISEQELIALAPAATFFDACKPKNTGGLVLGLLLPWPLPQVYASTNQGYSNAPMGGFLTPAFQRLLSNPSEYEQAWEREECLRRNHCVYYNPNTMCAWCCKREGPYWCRHPTCRQWRFCMDCFLRLHTDFSLLVTGELIWHELIFCASPEMQETVSSLILSSIAMEIFRQNDCYSMNAIVDNEIDMVELDISTLL